MIKLITRNISVRLIELALQYPVVTITGPRQSGKTTLVKQIFAHKKYINLELPDVREFAQNDPRAFLRGLPNGAILDEIQRVPDLVSYIQGIVDEKDQPGMFILTGSQQFELTNSINQSLAGRTALLKLLPLCVSELVSTYKNLSVDSLLFKGMYPRIYEKGLDPSQAIADYIATYIERDIRQLIQIKDLSLFQKFLRLSAGRTGQILNMQNLANDTGVSQTTIREWLTILEASYIIYFLQPYFSNVRKRLVKSPKLYFYDTGIVCFLLGIEKESQLATHYLKGNIFENFVVSEIIKYRFNKVKSNNLNFYRDSSGNEVDVIYNIADAIVPIEIKSAETFSQSFTKGFKHLEKVIGTFPYGKILFYAGELEQDRGNLKIRNIFSLQKELDAI